MKILLRSAMTPRLKFDRPRPVASKALRPRTLSNPIVQSKAATLTVDSPSVAFDSPVGAGNILVAFGLYGIWGAAAPSDNNSNVWNQPPIGDLSFPPPMWYVVGAAAGTTTITFPDISADLPGQ